MLTTTRERRTFMRMVIDAPVTLVRGSEHIMATCRDLSANGMAIDVENTCLFTMGETLKVSLRTVMRCRLLKRMLKLSGLIIKANSVS